MLSTAFMHLLPEAAEAADGAVFPWALAGFAAFYVIENFVMFHPCVDEHCELHRLGIISFIGLFVHSLLDGVAIAVGFAVGHGVGFFTAVSVILHELPEGISISGILTHAGMPRKKIWALSSLVALATPAGAIIFQWAAPEFGEYALAVLLSLTAGSFVYVAATDLIPAAHKKNNRLITLAFFAGAFLVAVGGMMLHAH
jgi:zinc transporter ZupT